MLQNWSKGKILVGYLLFAASNVTYWKMFQRKSLKKQGKGKICSVKHSYHMYIPQAISQKGDCYCCPSQKSPSHLHIIILIEHVLDNNNALFLVHMNLLKHTCALSDEVVDKTLSFPKKAPSFVNSLLREKYNRKLVIKTPLCSIQHCLSLNNPSKKRYASELSNVQELSMAADGAFIICGFLNPLCSTETFSNPKVQHPHDPSYNIMSLNSWHNSIATVVLYIPSTGTYYLPQLVSDTSCLRAKGLWLHNQGLATNTVLQMLPSNSLCIQNINGLPDAAGQLWKFTDVYCIDIHCCNAPKTVNSVILTGVHVPDSDICVPSDLMNISDKCWISYGKTKMRVINVYENILLKSLTNQQANMQDVRNMCLALSLPFLKCSLIIHWLLIVHS